MDALNLCITLGSALIGLISLFVVFHDRREKLVLCCPQEYAVPFEGNYYMGRYGAPPVISVVTYYIFKNIGAKVVEQKDFTRSITLHIPKNVSGFKALPPCSNDSDISPCVQREKNDILVKFNYLNPGDYFEFAVWASGPDPVELDVGRIHDGKIEKYDWKRHLVARTLAFVAAFVIVLELFFNGILNGPWFGVKGFVVAMLFLSSFGVPGLRNWWSRRKASTYLFEKIDIERIGKEMMPREAYIFGLIPPYKIAVPEYFSKKKSTELSCIKKEDSQNNNVQEKEELEEQEVIHKDEKTGSESKSKQLKNRKKSKCRKRRK